MPLEALCDISFPCMDQTSYHPKTFRKPLNQCQIIKTTIVWFLASVTLKFARLPCEPMGIHDLWYWPFAWTLLWTIVTVLDQSDYKAVRDTPARRLCHSIMSPYHFSHPFSSSNKTTQPDPIKSDPTLSQPWLHPQPHPHCTQSW